MDQKKVLHAGCGIYPIIKDFQGPEWKEIRLDNDPAVNPEIIAAITDLNMIGEAEFDAIWAPHTIVRIYPHEVLPALKEFYRILKNQGGLYMALPDLQSVAEYVHKGNFEGLLYNSAAGPISPIDVIYGFRKTMGEGSLSSAHKTGFIAHTMANHLKEAGFQDITVERKNFDLVVRAFKRPEILPESTKVTIIGKDLNKIMIERDNLVKEPEFKEGLPTSP
jgi:hypothetical protein